MGIGGAVAFSALAGLSVASEVYVPLGDDNKILVIDSRTDAVVGKIAGVFNAHGLAATQDGRLLIAGSLDERPVDAPVPERPAGVSADEHAAHHSERPEGARKPGAYVSTVSILRRSDRKVIRHIDVPGAVHHVAVSANNRIAAVTHPGEGTITLIDLGVLKVARTISTGLGPNYAAFDPTGKHLYVSNAGSETISDIDTAKWVVRRNLQVGKSPEHLVLSPDGAALYVTNVNDGTVSVLSLDSGKVTRTYTVGNTPHGMDLSEDGRTLFVSDRGNDQLYAIDVGSSSKVSVSLSPSPYHLVILPGEGKLYISSADEPKIWVVDQKTLQVTGEILIGGTGHQMVVLPRS